MKKLLLRTFTFASCFLLLSTKEVNAQTALTFSGNDGGSGTAQYDDIGNVPAMANFTIEFNIMHLGSGDSQYSRFVSSTNNGISLATDGSGDVEFYSNDLGIGWDNLGYTMPLNTWQHMAWVYNGSNISLYVNGAFVNSLSCSGTKSAQQWFIGINQANFTENSNCKIDNFRLWNVARTATQVSNNYQNCLTGTESGLIRLYNFEEGSGTVTTDLTGTQNGILNNGVTWSSGVACIPSGAALNFDGTNDYVAVPDNALLDFGTNDFSVEADFKSTASQASYAGLVAKTNNSGNGGFQLVLVGNKIAAEFSGSGNFLGTANGLQGTTVLNDGNWHHLAMVVSRSTNNIKLLVDGAVEANVTNALISTTNVSFPAASMYIGSERTVTAFINGYMDEVRVWNRALCQGEIQNNLTGELAGGQIGLVAYYKLNEGIASSPNATVTAVTDASGNNLTGTTTNLALTGSTSNWVAPGAVNTGSNSPTFVSPTVSIAGANTICSGSPTTFTASGVSTYTWTSGPTTATYAVSPTVTTTYSVVGTNSVGCNSAVTVKTLTVNTLPTISASTATITAGATTTLTASGSTSYTWNTSATTSTISVAPSTTTIYTVTNTNGCVNTITVDVFGAALNFNGGGSNYIAVTEVGSTLDNLGLANFTMEAWINPSNISGVTSIIRKSGDYNLYLNNGIIYAEVWPNGMGNSTFRKIAGATTLSLNAWHHVAFTWNNALNTGALYVNGIAEAITVTSPATAASESLRIGQSASFGQPFYGSIDELRIWNRALCQGEIQNSINGELATGQTGLELYYKFNEGISSASNATVTTAIDASGIGNNGTLANFTLNGTTSNWIAPGGVTTGSTSPTFVSPTISIAGANAICIGSATTFTASGVSTYTWTSGPTTATYAVSPTVTTTYSVVGTNSVGCNSGITVKTLTVNTLPIISVNSGTICAGSSFTMSPTGANTYTYSSGSAVVTPTANATYTVTGTSAAGCVSASGAVSTVTVNALPSITINSPTVCVGATATLTANGASTYTWSTSATGATITASPTITTNYTVTATDGNNCMNIRTSTITVNALPNLLITVTNNTICAGQKDTLTASGAISYTWSPGGATTPMVSGVLNTTKTFTVSAIDGNGCFNTATQLITVNPLPTVTVNSATICVGDMTTLTANGATTYTWNIGPTGPTITESPLSTTSYIVQGTDGNNCSNTATAIVTVNSLPTVTVNSATICVGNTATLTANGATSYTWNTGAATATYTDSPTGNTSYTVTGIDGNNCSNTATSTVTVNSLPTVSANTATICVGDMATLTASGATSYTWNTGSNSASITDSPTVTTTYTVNGTDGNNCSNWDTVSITVNTLPTLVVAPQTICPAATATLQANPSTLTSYTWSAGLSSTSGSSVTGNPSIYTTYSVSGTNANGCVGTTTTSIDVLSSFTVTAVAADTAVCGIGTTTSLSGAGASSYTWASSAGSMSSVTGTTITVTPSGLTTYTVTGSSGVCTAPIFTLAVNVHALPTVTVNSPTICAGDVATLNAGGAVSYTWNAGATGSTYTDSPAGNTDYTVTGTDLNNCSNSAVSSVVVNSLPIIVVNSPTICIGDAATLTASGAITYTWSTTETTSSISPTVTATTNYTITATDGNNCTSSDTTSIYVNALPTLTVTPQTICLAATATLVASPTTLATYTWSAGLSSTSGSSVTGSPAVFTTYTVSATDLNGCIGTTTTSIDVVSSLTVTAMATDTAICGVGNSTTLTGLGASSYTWTSSAGTMSGTSGSNITVTPSGLTTYTVEGSSGTCAASQYTLSVNVNALPTVSISASATTLCAGATATLTANGAITYTWSTSATTISIAASPTVTTNYTVTGTDANNCTNTDTLSLIVNCTVGIDKITASNTQISIYPNPNNGVFVIETTTQQTLHMFDVNGKLVLTKTIDGPTTLEMNNIVDGVYTITFISTAGTVNKKVIILR